VLGASHAETITTANQLALLLKEAGADEEAELLFKR
jgi:hypothetical protein